MSSKYAESKAERIKAVRIVLRMTQEEMAEKMDVAVDDVVAWENGTQDMGVASLIKFCDLFYVSSDYVLGTDDRKGPGCEYPYATAFRVVLCDDIGENIGGKTIRAARISKPQT